MCPSGSNSRLQPTSVSEIRPAFDVLDTDRDGKISLNDLKMFYSTFPNNNNNNNNKSTGAVTTTTIATDEEIGSMIAVADFNKDGFVEPEEFERVVLGNNRRRNSSSENEIMEEIFKVMDRDGDGKLGFNDLKNYMNFAGFSADDDEIRSMIRLGGGDENEGVCLQGLMKILAVDSSQGYF